MHTSLLYSWGSPPEALKHHTPLINQPPNNEPYCKPPSVFLWCQVNPPARLHARLELCSCPCKYTSHLTHPGARPTTAQAHCTTHRNIWGGLACNCCRIWHRAGQATPIHTANLETCTGKHTYAHRQITTASRDTVGESEWESEVGSLCRPVCQPPLISWRAGAGVNNCWAAVYERHQCWPSQAGLGLAWPGLLTQHSGRARQETGMASQPSGLLGSKARRGSGGHPRSRQCLAAPPGRCSS